MVCPVCRNRHDFKPLFPELCAASNYICEECGLVFIADEKISPDYYKSDGYFERSPNISLKEIFVSKNMLLNSGRKRISLILKLLGQNPTHGLKVLDVGCGYGELLAVLKTDFGCDVLGVEPSEKAAKKGMKMFDIEISPLLLEEFVESSTEQYDLVLCSHTLEHTSTPKTFLRNLQSLVKEDGFLYIEIPNVLCPTGGFDLNTFLYNEHLCNYSIFTLTKLIKESGMYIYSYSDKIFLKVVCAKNAFKEKQSIPFVSSAEIERYLTKYNSNYKFLNKIFVYLNKFEYLVRLIWYKIEDLLEVFTKH